MTVFKNVFALVMMAAAAGYIIIQMVYFPGNRNAQVMTAPALISGALYTLFFIDLQSARIARLKLKLRRAQPAQVKAFLAQVILWSVAVSALIYSAVTA